MMIRNLDSSFFFPRSSAGSILTSNYKLSVGTINPLLNLWTEKDQFNNNIRRLMRELMNIRLVDWRLLNKGSNCLAFVIFVSCAWDETGRKLGLYLERTNRWIIYLQRKYFATTMRPVSEYFKKASKTDRRIIPRTHPNTHSQSLFQTDQCNDFQTNWQSDSL